MSTKSRERDKTISSFDRDAYAARRKERAAAPKPQFPVVSITQDAIDATKANRAAASAQRSIDDGKRGAFGNANISNDERMQRHVRRYAVERIATLTNQGKLPLIPAKKKQNEDTNETQIQP